MPPPDADLPTALAAALEQLDALVELFQQHPDPAVQARAVALLQCVDAVHRPGLRRLAELLQVAGLRRRALDDPEVRLLFDLGVVPIAVEHGAVRVGVLAGPATAERRAR